MARINGYIKLILALTYSQLVYDISVVMVAFSGHKIEFSYIALRSASGLTATFFTNLIAFVVVYTVCTFRIVGMRAIFLVASAFTLGSCAYGVLVPIALYNFSTLQFEIVSKIYYWTRIASILFNMISYGILVLKLGQQEPLWLINRQSLINRRSETPIKAPTKSPLWALANRLRYYPVVQVFSRLPVAWYEYQYGHEYTYNADSPLQERISLILYDFALPSAGLGFFIVFIVVCPGAGQCLLSDFRRLFFCFLSPPSIENTSPSGTTPLNFRSSEMDSSEIAEDDEEGNDGRRSKIFLDKRRLTTGDDLPINKSDNSNQRSSIVFPRFEGDDYEDWAEDDLVAEIGRVFSLDQKQSILRQLNSSTDSSGYI